MYIDFIDHSLLQARPCNNDDRLQLIRRSKFRIGSYLRACIPLSPLCASFRLKRERLHRKVRLINRIKVQCSCLVTETASFWDLHETSLVRQIIDFADDYGPDQGPYCYLLNKQMHVLGRDVTLTTDII